MISCLKEIPTVFMNNHKCQKEIERMLQYVPKLFLKLPWKEIELLTMSLDTKDGYSHQIIIQKIAEEGLTHAVEWTKTGYSRETKANNYYMAITDHFIEMKIEEMNRDAKSLSSQKIIYQKTPNGFVRQMNLKREDYNQQNIGIYVEKEKNEYMMNDHRTIEITRNRHASYYDDTKDGLDSIADEKIKCQRCSSDLFQVFVEKNGESFVSTIEEQDFIPSFDQLLKTKKPKTVHQKTYTYTK